MSTNLDPAPIDNKKSDRTYLYVVVGLCSVVLISVCVATYCEIVTLPKSDSKSPAQTGNVALEKETTAPAATEDIKAHTAADDRKHAGELRDSGEQAFGRHDFTSAETSFKQALQLYESDKQPQGGYIAWCKSRLGDSANGRGDFATADSYYSQVLSAETAVADKQPKGEAIRMATAHEQLAFNLQCQEKFKDADAHYREALAWSDRTEKSKWPYLNLCVERYSNMLKQTGRKSEADALLSRYHMPSK